jgi:hypothetical protein
MSTLLRRRFLGLVAACAALAGCTTAPVVEVPPPVLLGNEVLAAGGFKELAGKRVGLITNPSGVNRRLESTLDVLRRAPGVRLVALFGPEHGIYGDVPAGDKIESRTDASAPACRCTRSTARPASPRRRCCGVSMSSCTICRIPAAAPTPSSARWALRWRPAPRRASSSSCSTGRTRWAVRVEGPRLEDPKLRSFVSQWDRALRVRDDLRRSGAAGSTNAADSSSRANSPSCRCGAGGARWCGATRGCRGCRRRRTSRRASRRCSRWRRGCWARSAA